jgi:hypothetical protein
MNYSWSTLLALVLLGFGPVLGPRYVIAQTLTFDRASTIAGPADLVESAGRYCYIAADRTLTIVDISNPANPQRLGSYEFPERIWGFTVIDSLVYVAADFFGLGILDVSEPMTPKLLGSVKTPGQAKNVDVSGTTAVLADHMSGVDLVDVSNLENPVVLGSVYLDGYGRDVTVHGSLAYAVDNPSGFYVVDLSETDIWEPMSAIHSAMAPRTVEAESNVAILLGEGALQVYDISTPTEPVHQSTYQTPGRSIRVELEGSMAYLADGKEGLLVMDLTNLEEPQIAGTYPTAQPVRDVAITEDVVLLVVGALPTGISRSQGGGEVLVLRLTR